METIKQIKKPDLKKYGIKNAHLNWDLSPEELQRITIKKGMGT